MELSTNAGAKELGEKRSVDILWEADPYTVEDYEGASCQLVGLRVAWPGHERDHLLGGPARSLPAVTWSTACAADLRAAWDGWSPLIGGPQG